MTWHIFNSDGHHVGTCDHEPNHEDLADRGETAYYYQHNGRGTLIVKDDAVVVIPPAPSRYHVLQDGEWALTPTAAEQQFADAKAVKLDKINRAAQEFVWQVSKAYEVPEFERQTWSKQAAEALAWEQNPSAPTPLLAQIAADRGCDLDGLRAKALQKAKQFAALSASVAGQRQAYVDRLEQAQDVDKVEAISPVYHLPTHPVQVSSDVDNL